MLDTSVAYNRYRFLGQEFLTWLWYMIASGEYASVPTDGVSVTLAIDDRMILENRQTKEIETITIKGNQADLQEGMVALAKGALVAELGLSLHVDEQAWKFTLKGESLGITNLKTPTTSRPETAEDVAGAVLEKAYLYETVFNLTDKWYRTFIKQRISDHWKTDIGGKIKNWIQNNDHGL